MRNYRVYNNKRNNAPEKNILRIFNEKNNKSYTYWNTNEVTRRLYDFFKIKIPWGKSKPFTS